jgi:hypothetical protein
MVPPDFSLAQRVALYPWICKERCTEWPGADTFDVAPCAAQVLGVDDGVCEYDGRIAAAKEDFARQHACPTIRREEKTLVQIRSAQSLEKHAHAHTGATVRDTRRERSTVGEPWPIASGRDGRRVPRQILRELGHDPKTASLRQAL